MTILYSLSFLHFCCMIHMAVAKNKTVYTYQDSDGIIIIFVAIYHYFIYYLTVLSS